MKTKRSLVTILAVLIVTIGFASEKVNMNIIPLNAEIALVAFNAGTPTSLEVTIKNSGSETVYYYKSEKEQYTYRGKFDFSNLEKGNYLVSVNYGKNSLNSELTVTKYRIEASPVYKSMAPYFRQKDDQLNVSFLNLAQKQVYFNVYKNEVHVAGAKLGKDLSIQKCLNLSKLDDGEYKVVISDEYNEHTFTVCK